LAAAASVKRSAGGGAGGAADSTVFVAMSVKWSRGEWIQV